jgi:hypothetical protein
MDIAPKHCGENGFRFGHLRGTPQHSATPAVILPPESKPHPMTAEQEKSRFRYEYSVFQMEYSRNLLFRSGRRMEEIFQALIDRTRAPLDLDRIKTTFGDKHRPHRDTR